MADVKVVKKTSEEKGLARPAMFDFPLMRHNLFTMNPFAMMRDFLHETDRFYTKGSMEKAEWWAPVVEAKRADGNFVVTAELPGLKKEEVKVQVLEDTLTVEGERKQEKEEKSEEYYRSERSYGRFYRSIPLPEGADVDKAKAEFSNGLLRVSIPCAEMKQKVKEIPVQETKSTA
ncbi:MAG: Hsp20/alpha crystallin family protein [Bryobacterales bacterium]|nr:Hsp20/alpha crystallin family protein [Bryobacterales bacterium]